MTAWGLELLSFFPWASSLCQTFTVPAFSCCLFVGVSAFSLVFRTRKALLGCDQMTDLANVEFRSFCCMFCVMIHLQYEAATVLQHLFESEQRIYCPWTSEFILTFIRSQVINKHQWPSSTGSRTCPCHDTASTIFDKWCGMLWVMSCSILFSILSFLYKLILVSSVHRIWFQNRSGFFRCFLAKSYLAFLFLSFITVIYILLWSICIYIYKASLNFKLWLWHYLPPQECSWCDWMLWKGSSSTWTEFCSRPLQLSSMILQAFSCCQLILSF